MLILEKQITMLRMKKKQIAAVNHENHDDNEQKEIPDYLLTQQYTTCFGNILTYKNIHSKLIITSTVSTAQTKSKDYA